MNSLGAKTDQKAWRDEGFGFTRLGGEVLCEQGVFARVTSNGMSVFARRSEGFQLRVTVGEYIGILWSVDRGAPQGTAAIETVRK